jgi:hypothetical protein
MRHSHSSLLLVERKDHSFLATVLDWQGKLPLMSDLEVLTAVLFCWVNNSHSFEATYCLQEVWNYLPDTAKHLSRLKWSPSSMLMSII